MKMSIIIPTCNRPRRLLNCLSALRGADEIVVSDDSVTSESYRLIQAKFQNVIWIQGPRRGPAANRNHGAAHATGDWLAFLDDDCLPAANWLSEIRNVAKRSDVVEGKTICPNKTNHPFEDIVENLSGDLLWSCNLALRRSLFEDIGGFDEDFLIAGGEDLEFGSRLRQCAKQITFIPEAVVFHPARRLTFVGLVNKAFQMHWHILYRLKIDASRFATSDEVFDLFRHTARQMLAPSAKRNLQGIARLLITWSVLPLWILYLSVWEMRFRKQGLELKSAFRRRRESE
jgi:GT2 family glycosyltransferase